MKVEVLSGPSASRCAYTLVGGSEHLGWVISRVKFPGCHAEGRVFCEQNPFTSGWLRIFDIDDE